MTTNPFDVTDTTGSDTEAAFTDVPGAEEEAATEETPKSTVTSAVRDVTGTDEASSEYAEGNPNFRG